MKLILLIMFLVTRCGTPDTAVVPAKVTEFDVAGKSIAVHGKLKDGAAISVEQAKSAVATSVDLLESK